MKKEEKKLLIRKGLVKIRLARKMAHKTVNWKETLNSNDSQEQWLSQNWLKDRLLRKKLPKRNIIESKTIKDERSRTLNRVWRPVCIRPRCIPKTDIARVLSLILSSLRFSELRAWLVRIVSRFLVHCIITKLESSACIFFASQQGTDSAEIGNRSILTEPEAARSRVFGSESSKSGKIKIRASTTKISQPPLV